MYVSFFVLLILFNLDLFQHPIKTAYASSTQLTNTVNVCGCIDTSACPGSCMEVKFNECSMMYQCFQQANGLFAYIYPVFNANTNTVSIQLYEDKNCTQRRFIDLDPSDIGWEGLCDDTCWSQTSQIGSGGCNLSTDTSGVLFDIHQYSLLLMLIMTGLVSFLQGIN